MKLVVLIDVGNTNIKVCQINSDLSHSKIILKFNDCLKITTFINDHNPYLLLEKLFATFPKNTIIVFSSVVLCWSAIIVAFAKQYQLVVYDALNLLNDLLVTSKKKVSDFSGMGTDLVLYLYACRCLQQKNCLILVCGSTNLAIMIENNFLIDLKIMPGLVLQQKALVEHCFLLQNHQVTDEIVTTFNYDTKSSIITGCLTATWSFFDANINQFIAKNFSEKSIYLTGGLMQKITNYFPKILYFPNLIFYTLHNVYKNYVK